LHSQAPLSSAEGTSTQAAEATGDVCFRATRCSPTPPDVASPDQGACGPHRDREMGVLTLAGADVAFSPMWVTTNGFKARTVVASAAGWGSHMTNAEHPNATVPDSVEVPLAGALRYELGFPTPETSQKLFDEMDFQRAVQAYLWGYPAVSFESIRLTFKQDLGIGFRDPGIAGNFVHPNSAGDIPERWPQPTVSTPTRLRISGRAPEARGRSQNDHDISCHQYDAGRRAPVHCQRRSHQSHFVRGTEERPRGDPTEVIQVRF
jgi:hypothetical protein